MYALNFSYFIHYIFLHRFAPLALNIIYEENPVDCQRLAKLQGIVLLLLYELGVACYAVHLCAGVLITNLLNTVLDTA